MMHMENRRRLCVLLLILNLAFIWGNSMLSAEQSQAFSDWVKALLSRPFGSGGSESGGSGTLRKVAHFSEFASLGLLLAWLASMAGERGIHGWAMPLFGGMAAACVDETIQVFVPNRGPGLIDVWIDTAGAATGITLFILLCRMGNRRKAHKKII